MLKSVKTIMRQEKEPYRIPRKVQDAIPIQRIWPDGIFLVGKNRFSKCWKIKDINYLVASKDEQEAMFNAYAALLNASDGTSVTKITLLNHSPRQADFEDTVLMPMKYDGLDEYRDEENQNVLNSSAESKGIIQDKYVTVTVTRRCVEDARSFFKMAGAELARHLIALDSKLTEMTADDRLRILYDFYRNGEENFYQFDLMNSMRMGHSFKDYICPDGLEKHSDYLVLGNKFVRVLYLKYYASYIRDWFISELTDAHRNMMLSIDIITVPMDEAIRVAENKLLSVETNITNWQRRQNSANNFSAVIPYDMEQQRKESKSLLEDLTARDQRMMLAVITMSVMADSLEELDRETERILSAARTHMCQIAPLKYQQLDALNTVLPIGVRKINAFRTLNSESLAVFMPFKVQEVMDEGGIYMGENAISHNLIMCNRDTLQNQSSIIFGVPGSGKSFITKQMIASIMLNSEDDVIICDPEGEYVPLVEIMGEQSSVIRVSAGGHDRLNAMYMVEGYGDSNPMVVKSEFIMSLIEQMDSRAVSAAHKSIIDRCIAAVYRNAAKSKKPPTLSTLREILMEQPEPEAQEIALSLELYTTGSLDIFGHESNVDLDKRIVVFDIHGLGAQLKPAGLLVITDTMINRVSLNWKRGKRTHVFIDEFHVVFENEHSAEFFDSAWRQFRKRGAWPTAITQNAEYLWKSKEGVAMLSNSEFVVMLNQAEPDRERLAKILKISNEQMSYITNSAPGCGLIKYGGSLVPFVNRFDKNTKLYRLMTTKPGEGAFAGTVG